MYYVLRLKTTAERIDRIKSHSMENAKTFFMSRKQMDEESTLIKIYILNLQISVYLTVNSVLIQDY